MPTQGYQQFCPVAMACEMLEPRWTMLILCEIWSGSMRFSDIQRGVPGMSPSLLSKRLKDMAAQGLLIRTIGVDTHADYRTTAMADELEPLVPLMSMARQRRTELGGEPVGLLLSARSRAEAPFFDELVEMDTETPGFSFTATFTRERPQRAADFGRRVDQKMIQAVLDRLGRRPDCTYICGSHRFVDVAADSVLAAGIPAGTVRTERYGG